MLELNEKDVPRTNSSSNKTKVICVSDETTTESDDDACSSDAWITVGNMTFNKEINGKLSDKYINMGQRCIKQHFPSI